MGCQQSIWMSNVINGTCKWFQREIKKSVFTKKSIQNYSDDSDNEYILKVDISYS